MALGLPPDEKCVDDQVLRYQNAWAQRMADILKVHLCLATQKILELSFGRKKQDNVQCEGIQNKKQIAGNCFFSVRCILPFDTPHLPIQSTDEPKCLHGTNHL